MKEENKSLVEKAVSIIHKKLDDQLEKAKGMVAGEVDKTSIDFDPWYRGDEGGYRRKPTRFSYKLANTLSKKSSIISSIIQIRQNQVASFSEVQSTKYDVGFVIEHKDKDKELSESDKSKIRELQDFVINCGYKDRKPKEEDVRFDEFLRRVVRDRLTYDQVGVEKVRDRDDNIVYFAPIDGSTIRFATPPREGEDTQKNTLSMYDQKKDQREKDVEYSYVQVVEETIQRAFTREDIIFRMSNKTNDIQARGYSLSEIEILIATITNHLNAETYNSKIFTQGHVQKGILHFKANISQRKLNMFKKAWYAQSSGVINSWRTPILAGMEDVKWIQLQENNKDIEFHLWMEYCIKIICSIFLIDPSELNFDISQGRSGGNPMFQSGNEFKLKQSKDRGLRPILRFIADIINDIIEEIDSNYIFKFVGQDAESKQSEVDRNKTEVETYKSINEVRKENGLSPIEFKVKVGSQEVAPYDLPMNPQAAQLVTTLVQFLQGQQSQQAGNMNENNNSNNNASFSNNDSQSNGENRQGIDEYQPEEDFGKSKKVKIEYFTIKS